VRSGQDIRSFGDHGTLMAELTGPGTAFRPTLTQAGRCLVVASSDIYEL